MRRDMDGGVSFRKLGMDLVYAMLFTRPWCVIKARQFAEARKLINSVDPDVFMTVPDTKDVYGKGFMNDF